MLIERLARPFFENLLGAMKPGACLLFIDNNDSRFKEWIEELADQFGLKLLSESDGKKNVGYDEEKSHLGNYIKLFPASKLGGDASYRIWRKV